jgi:predicted RNA-binding protein
MAVIRSYTKVWDETTSFALVETNETIDVFEQRLWLSKFDSTKDKLLVIDVSYDTATFRGTVKKIDTLKSLLPGIVQK